MNAFRRPNHDESALEKSQPEEGLWMVEAPVFLRSARTKS